MGSVGIAECVVGLGMLGVSEPQAGNSAFPCCVLIRGQLKSEISRANPTVLPPRLFGLFPKVLFCWEDPPVHRGRAELCYGISVRVAGWIPPC